MLCVRCQLSYSTAKAGDMTFRIWDSVMKSSADYSYEYLQVCLLFMKYSFIYDLHCSCKAIKMVEEEDSIKVPIGFGSNTARGYKNRLRRVMMQQEGKAQYG